MLNNEIKTCINEFAKNNGISLNSELSKYDDFGKVCIDIVSTINISHIGNLFNSLTKLDICFYELLYSTIVKLIFLVPINTESLSSPYKK
mgnify:CR=1 FL=1